MSGIGFVTASVHKGSPGPPITMAFPCYAGPALRGLTTVLLYREKIHVSIPSLFDKEQYFVFRKAGDLARQNGRSCLEAFALADQQFHSAVEQSSAARLLLAPLATHFEFLQIVNDGSPEWYDNVQRSVDPHLLGVVQSALNDDQQLNVAAREFIWRVFSAHLHFEGDLSRVVDHLERHLTDWGSTAGLLAESLLNRYMLIPPGDASITAFSASDDRSAQIVSCLARDAPSQESSVESRSDLLAFVLFDELLGEHLGPLVAPNVERVAKLFAERSRELRAMRDRCRREATQLVSEAMEANAFVRRVRDALATFREEVSALLEVTQSTFSKMVRTLMENGTFWTSLAVLGGTAIGNVGAAIPTAVGAGVAGQIAAAAAKARNERRELVKTSHWSFVYHARRQGFEPGEPQDKIR
jgi:hypothetical protein